MKILVLGGTGFIGKNLTQALKKTKHKIFTASRSQGLNLLNYPATKRFFEAVRPEAIINCAANSGSVHHVAKYAADVLHDNVQMTLNIYRAAKEVCPQTRIINPLSNCSYPGEAQIHFEPAWFGGQVHETVYGPGHAKRTTYMIAHCYHKQYGLRSVNFLVPNAFGPGDSTDLNRVHALNGMIIRMIKAHQSREPQFEIWGTGKPVREWIYVNDIVNVLKKGLTTTHDLIYPVNIAQGRGYSIKESAKLIADSISYAGQLAFNSHYQDGAMRKVLDNRKFRKLFPGYKFTDHKEGINNTVKYYQSILT